MAESFVDSYKTELIGDRVWRTRSQLELATVEWVAWFSNQRLHEALGDIPPVEYDHLHAAQTNPEPLISVDGSVAARVPKAADGATTRRLERGGVGSGPVSPLESYNEPVIRTWLARNAPKVADGRTLAPGLCDE